MGALPERERLLHIYLRDHLAGAVGGVALARRIAGSRADLREFADDLAHDRETLLQIMKRVGATPDPIKSVGALLGERLGRLKLNGRLVRRSRLSDLLELELMRSGVDTKAAGWRTLRALADHDQRLDALELDRLIVRATAQTELLERLRLQAAGIALGA